MARNEEREARQAALEPEDNDVRLALLALFAVAGLLSGCDRTPEAFAADSGVATFDPVMFFAGPTHSWGVVENRSGTPSEWIKTDSQGWVDRTNKLRMVQHLRFQDGAVQQRDWTLWRSGPDRFDATASDMVGSATGEAIGGMFHWQWVLARSPGNALLNVTMNQWMYRLRDGSVMIRTTISKFGFIAAEASEVFVRGERS